MDQTETAFAAAIEATDKRTRELWDRVRGDPRYSERLFDGEKWCVKYADRGEVCGDTFDDMVEKAARFYAR
jgi:hypothetical protein